MSTVQDGVKQRLSSSVQGGNTRFLDFLAAKSKAQVVVEGQLNIRNNTQGHLQNVTGVPNFTDGNAVANNAYFDYEDIYGTWFTWGNAVPGAANSEVNYTFIMYDTKGTAITLSATGAAGSVMTLRFTRVTNTNDNRTLYTAQVLGGGATFNKNGKNMGNKVNGYNLEIRTAAASATANDAWAAYANNWENGS